MRWVRRAVAQTVFGALLVLLLEAPPATLAQPADRPSGAESGVGPPAGLTIVQSPIQVSLEGGMAAEGELRFTSDAIAPSQGYVSVVEYRLGPDGPLIRASAESDPSSAARWISLEPTVVTLQPGTSMTVRYRLQVPPQVAPGDYSALVLLESDPPAARLGVRLAVTVPGPAGARAELLAFGARPDPLRLLGFETRLPLPLVSGGPVRLLTQVQNQGTALLPASGSVRILDPLGNQLASLELPAELVYPGDILTLASQWSPPFPLGLFSARLDLETGGPSIVAERRFLVLPIESILAMALFLLGIWLLLGRRTRLPRPARARRERPAVQPVRSDELVRARLAYYNPAPLHADPAPVTAGSPDRLTPSLADSPATAHPAELVRSGQQLARTGYRLAAFRLFCQALEIDPGHEEAWLWRAGTSQEPEETIRCLERVLQINPENSRARRGLSELQARVP